jgi:hypothetical protein
VRVVECGSAPDPTLRTRFLRSIGFYLFVSSATSGHWAYESRSPPSFPMKEAKTWGARIGSACLLFDAFFFLALSRCTSTAACFTSPEQRGIARRDPSLYWREAIPFRRCRSRNRMNMWSYIPRREHSAPILASCRIIAEPEVARNAPLR